VYQSEWFAEAICSGVVVSKPAPIPNVTGKKPAREYIFGRLHQDDTSG